MKKGTFSPSRLLGVYSVVSVQVFKGLYLTFTLQYGAFICKKNRFLYAGFLSWNMYGHKPVSSIERDLPQTIFADQNPMCKFQICFFCLDSG